MSKKDIKEKTIGNYQFIKTIGEGTFGKVKLSVHLPTNEYVAIKILEKSKIHDKEELERVEKEIKYLKVFNHIHIIQIYEVIETDKNFYIVMEYVSGGELFNYIVDHEKLSEKEASFFLVQIIYGIREIHKKNICHRDIKPENLLLTEKKIIKIIDFGLSNEYVDYLSTQCGSPCYASPEMIRGMKYSGLMVDIWACGIILYAMLCGYLPFDDKDNNILFRKILQCKLEFPEENEVILSNEAKDLIKRILVPNPLKRITIDEILCHPFLESGLEEYKKEVENPASFNQENIIIDYMVSNLKYSNENQEINKLIKANKHNSCTTTYKLLEKKIIEGRFDYNYNIIETNSNESNDNISPIKNLKIKINVKNKEKSDKNIINFNNLNNKKNLNVNKNKNPIKTKKQNIKASLRKSLREENDSKKKHNINKTRSFDSTKKISVSELNIPRNKQYIENNAILTLKNKNILIKDLIKMNPLYQKLLSNKKNLFNFKRQIDTSVSVVKKIVKRRKKKKQKSSSPPKYVRYIINPFANEKDIIKSNIERNKMIYLRKYLILKKKGLSVDKVKGQKKKKMPKPLFKNYFGGLKNLDIKLKEIRKGYALTPISKIKNINTKIFGLSADKITQNLPKLKKLNVNTNKKNITNIKKININQHKPIISEISTFASSFSPENISNINSKKIKIKINNIKNNLIEHKTVQYARTPINIRRKNNMFYNNKLEQNKKIPYINIINNNKNYNTIQTDEYNNCLVSDNNQMTNNTMHTNIIYNNYILQENHNKKNNENKDKINLKKKINIQNNKYIPLTSRTKPLNFMDINSKNKKMKTINITNENLHSNGNNILLKTDRNNNNLYIVKKPEINNFLITNINLNVEQIKNILRGYCKKNKYKCYYNNDKSRYTICIDNINSFYFEINNETRNNNIINLYHNKGSDEITKQNMNKLWSEMIKYKNIKKSNIK